MWDTIERSAFRPNKPGRWLGVYAKTLNKLWDIEPTWVRFARNDNFYIPFMNLKCSYFIEHVGKYSVSLAGNSSTNHLCWQSHIDPEFLSKASLHTSTDRYPGEQMSELRNDVAAVLDGMFFHPRCHVHPEDLGVQHVQLDPDRGCLSSHEVRIGGGIENPYVFLFHLRYQFCLLPDPIRNGEQNRLIELFKNTVCSRDHTISPSELFDFHNWRCI